MKQVYITGRMIGRVLGIGLLVFSSHYAKSMISREQAVTYKKIQDNALKEIQGEFDSYFFTSAKLGANIVITQTSPFNDGDKSVEVADFLLFTARIFRKFDKGDFNNLLFEVPFDTAINVMPSKKTQSINSQLKPKKIYDSATDSVMFNLKDNDGNDKYWLSNTNFKSFVYRADKEKKLVYFWPYGGDEKKIPGIPQEAKHIYCSRDEMYVANYILKAKFYAMEPFEVQGLEFSIGGICALILSKIYYILSKDKGTVKEDKTFIQFIEDVKKAVKNRYKTKADFFEIKTAIPAIDCLFKELKKLTIK